METTERLREKSRSFPTLNLKDCIASIEMIRRAVGKTPQDKVTFAKAMGHKDVSGPYLSKFASLIQFGLVSKTKTGQYILTESSYKILKPLSQEEKSNELLAAFKRPPLFLELLEQELQNQTFLPSHLDTILNRKYSITEKSSKNAAESFRESGAYAGLFTDTGEIKSLSRNSLIISDQKNSDTDSLENFEKEQPLEQSLNKTRQSNEHRYSFPLSNGMAYLNLPGKVNQKDIEKLRKHIEILELEIEE
jgi:hypothetical protein